MIIYSSKAVSFIKNDLVIGNLADAQTILGDLKQAEGNLRRRVNITQEIKNDYSEAIGHDDLGLLLTYTGRYEQADKELQKALYVWVERKDESGQCIVWSYRALRAILMDEPETAFKALDTARHFWELAAKHLMPVEHDLVQILWLSGAAKRQIPDLSAAEVDLNNALSRCRKIRLVGLEADILLELAKLHWQKAAGKNKHLIAQAKNLTREALEIADRCEFRLQQADIQNFLAEMAMAESDKQSARKHAETAKERAYCDGPPPRLPKSPRHRQQSPRPPREKII